MFTLLRVLKLTGCWEVPRRRLTLVFTVAAGLSAWQLFAVRAAEIRTTRNPIANPAAPFNASPAIQDDETPPFAPVVIPATIQAFFVTDLYAKDAGYVSAVNSDIGDHVKQGQVLAVIEDPELKAQFNRAQAAVEQAKATLEVAKRQLVGMQADLTLQKVTAKRQKELFEGRAATAQTLDEAQAKEDVSSATVETGRAKIALAEADLQAAKAEADRLEALLQYDKIAAPFDGVVTRRLVNPGDLVQSATTTRTASLFTVQKIDVVRVFADAPEAHASGIRPGLRAQVKLYGTATVTVEGTVTRIASALDPATRTMRVEIDLLNSDERMLPGMYAQVTLGEPHGFEPAKP